MDSDQSVIVSSVATSTYPVPFHLSFLPPKFEISNQLYNFTGIPNHDVTYKIIFPHGILLSVNDPLFKTDVKKTSDDRYYIMIRFDSSEANLSNIVSCKMVPSAFFILSIFSPCILSFFITIVLIITIFLIRRKRKGRKISRHIEEEPIDYAGEEYYIPPQPGKK
jgi:hypothetical protein